MFLSETLDFGRVDQAFYWSKATIDPNGIAFMATLGLYFLQFDVEQEKFIDMSKCGRANLETLQYIVVQQYNHVQLSLFYHWMVVETS